VVILARWFYRAVCSVWLLIAWAVGSTVRRFGRNARELESDHRRDGIGLLFLGLAIVFAGSIWARMDNLAGQGIYTVTTAVVGEGSFAIPVLFALVGWRFFRHPDRNSALPPAEIGWTAMLVGGLGLFSIARGVPTLAHADGGWPAVKTAGGFIGMVAAWPLATGLTPWVATPLLALAATGCSSSPGRRSGTCPTGWPGWRSCSATSVRSTRTMTTTTTRTRTRTPSLTAGRAAATSAAARSS
jgi:tellurite resistance protein TehA-like permease